MPRICKGPPPQRPGDGPIKASCLAADAPEIAQNHLQRQVKISRNPVAVDATAAAAKNRRPQGSGRLMTAYDGQRRAGSISRAPTGFFAFNVGCGPLEVFRTRSEALRAVPTASRDLEVDR
jgi:hypothetical protein